MEFMLGPDNAYKNIKKYQFCYAERINYFLGIHGMSARFFFSLITLPQSTQSYTNVTTQ